MKLHLKNAVYFAQYLSAAGFILMVIGFVMGVFTFLGAEGKQTIAAAEYEAYFGVAWIVGGVMSVVVFRSLAYIILCLGHIATQGDAKSQALKASA